MNTIQMRQIKNRKRDAILKRKKDTWFPLMISFSARRNETRKRKEKYEGRMTS